MRQSNQILNQSNLFDNPMVNSAKASMTPEQIEEYKIKGEAMYNTVDFESNGIIGNEDPLLEFVAYIKEGLKSGLHPSCLSVDECTAMENMYGKEWEKEWLI